MMMAALAVSLFRVPPVMPSPVMPAARGVHLQKVSGRESTLSEETILRDLSPMFLPTERNATLRKLPVREPGRTFLEIEAPKLGMPDGSWRFDRTLPPIATLNGIPLNQATPLDHLEAAAWEVNVAGFGRDRARIPTVEPRGALIEVVRERDGQRVMSDELEPKVLPPTNKLWQPVEFLAVVAPAGLAVPLSVRVRSGVEELDIFFRNYLSRTYRIGDRLAPGFYRITVAP